jgi:hypothetical protein
VPVLAALTSVIFLPESHVGVEKVRVGAWSTESAAVMRAVAMVFFLPARSETSTRSAVGVSGVRLEDQEELGGQRHVVAH